MATQPGYAGAHPQLRWCGSRLPIPAACPKKVFSELLTQERCGDSPRGISPPGFPQGRGGTGAVAPAGPFWEEWGSPQPCYCTNAASPTLYHCRKFEFNPKDGIDNPALSLAEDTDGEGVGEPRFYLLSKDSTETFGFCLHEELGCQGHVIRQVELGGLAQRRGLQDGDRLLQVNGHFVDHMDHRTVVQKIKASGNQVLLAVLDGGSYEAAKVLGRDLSQMLPADIRPRLCHITRDRSGFGFSVSGPEGVKGTFQLSVRQDGPAERAGVPPGSWLLELNGASVRSYSHAQLARKLKQSGNKVTLLVASSAVEEFYRLRGLQITAALADTSWLPFKVRELHMVKGPAGYGFLLKEDDCISGAIGQFLWDVDAGLPAEQAGMKEGDRLLAVNGESIEGLDHQQTVLRIRARDDQVTLLVIDPAGDEFYQSIGLSPLLFFVDGDPASGSRRPSLPSPSVSPGLCHVEVGPKGPGSWLVAAANSIEITQSLRQEEHRRLHQAF
ncbi:Na(+)/H(+) exchange regulatory cofactor NHE-RF4 isoform X2 [Rissa tridactyla]|uniref:Na(+)/H(+) exchange regulatory cofactor NHE-RF4 isoform X2 n=1 Tax=Rissa tridactyla TaxID=75485 RepID=UPI0023BAD83E|nr:Na(+)/H(+) exchange regulatory cofactor NHE-RF4 isoform X2 [Rissa tridactyla]